MSKICCLFFFYDSCVVIRVISFVQWRIGYWVRPFNICFLFWVDELAISSHGLRSVTRSAVLHAVSLRVRQRCFFSLPAWPIPLTQSGSGSEITSCHLIYETSCIFVLVKTYTVSQKKQDTKLLPITSPNINRFSKFFHCWTQ